MTTTLRRLTYCCAALAMVLTARPPSAEARLARQGVALSDGELVKQAEAGDLAGLKQAVAAGTAVDARDEKHDGTALMWAGEAGHLEVVKFLVASGADVNATNPNTGDTPRCWCSPSTPATPRRPRS